MQVMKKKPSGGKGRASNKPTHTKIEQVKSFFRCAAATPASLRCGGCTPCCSCEVAPLQPANVAAETALGVVKCIDSPSRFLPSAAAKLWPLMLHQLGPLPGDVSLSPALQVL